MAGDTAVTVGGVGVGAGAGAGGEAGAFSVAGFPEDASEAPVILASAPPSLFELFFCGVIAGGEGGAVDVDLDSDAEASISTG
mmetsp:Transcript_27973/g.60695  ORF Transcript_27973/g.60695 Transcript_27973/m.60695 type:complete len:83 (-) Transcript_27973:595-843(-)